MALKSKVTKRGAYKAAVCKGRNEVARCSGNIEGRLQTRELGSNWHSLCGIQRRKSSKKTATANLREFVDLHETAMILAGRRRRSVISRRSFIG